jgi:leucine dehydrogenase
MVSIQTSIPLEHAEVRVRRGPRSGLHFVIAIHDWGDGTALGGCRMLPCEGPGAALLDALALSRAMTYKCASVALPHGGGKCVIALPPGEPLHGEAREAVLLDVGDAVEELGGRFRTGTDAGTTVDDFLKMSERTEHLVGLPASAGGSGDSSELTADGVVAALEATAEHVFGSSDLRDKRVNLLGLGKVGAKIADTLAGRGASLTVADIDADKRELADQLGAAWSSPEKLLEAEGDFLAPCALGGVLDQSTAAKLRCAAVVGAANNQLANASIGELLQERGIVWAPDFIANAGGLISVASEVDGYSEAEARERTAAIGTVIEEVLALAEREEITPLSAAERRAEAVIATGRSQAPPAR